MRTVPLGNTGIEVSVFCLGAMNFGGRTDEATSYRLLDQYIEAGGSFLDTANIYVRGESETLLGRWMRKRDNRSRMFVATKIGVKMPGVDWGLRAEQIETECEKSLKRLGIETIDLYYAHVDDRHMPMEETLEAFNRLVKVGKVRFIGASNFWPWRLEEACWTSRTHKWANYCCIQQRYSYLRPEPGADFGVQIAADNSLLDYCRTRGITMLAYSPLLGGSYTRTDKPLPKQYVGPVSDSCLTTLRAIAEEKRATANQIVLAWMVQSEPCVIPLVAASTADQMKENLAALEIELNTDQVTRLNNTSV